jgi:hypothetical protein
MRQQTEYGTLRTYIRFGVQVDTPVGGNVGTSPLTFWDRAFMQFAGFTVGRAQSFFDLFTYGGGMSYHNVRTQGDTGAAGIGLWAYTAQFGNGFSGTLSVEDPSGRQKGGAIDVTRALFFDVNGIILSDNAFNQNPGFGFRNPDIVANLRVDQAWGFFGISGALHDSSGAYFATPNNVNNGHPADRLGWAAAVGGALNLQGGDQIGANFCYSQGAAGFCTNQGAFQVYNSSTNVGTAWIADGVFGTGSGIELTRVWSAVAGYQHIWNPKWRTSLFGGYVNVDYNGAATDLINASLPVGSVCFRGPDGTVGALAALIPLVGNSCSPDYSFYEIGTRTQWNPVAQLDIGLEVLYTHHNTAYKGPGVYANPAATQGLNGARPAVFALDDQDVLSAMFRWQRNFYP